MLVLSPWVHGIGVRYAVSGFSDGKQNSKRKEEMGDQTKPNNAHVEQRLREEAIIWFTTVRADGGTHTYRSGFCGMAKPFSSLANLAP
jgi:hypothetical protein